jgi:hypothetical protein
MKTGETLLWLYRIFRVRKTGAVPQNQNHQHSSDERRTVRAI